MRPVQRVGCTELGYELCICRILTNKLMAIQLNQIDIGPRVVLERRGCVLEEAIELDSRNYFKKTPLSKEQRHSSTWDIGDVLKEKFPEIVSLCRKSHLGKQFEINEANRDLVKTLQEWGILANDLSLNIEMESFGSLFECIVGLALHSSGIQHVREGKIRYPFPQKPYDPDGHLYDILGAIDISKLIWIECKKPLYLKDNNPLGQVVSKKSIHKFLRRSHLLKPDIAVYLVDTKEHYGHELKKLFNTNFLSTGKYVDHFEHSNNIIARISDFIYFTRVDYSSNNQFYQGVKDSVNQTLYDATRIQGGHSSY